MFCMTLRAFFVAECSFLSAGILTNVFDVGGGGGGCNLIVLCCFL